jgi:hypothetical protein
MSTLPRSRKVEDLARSAPSRLTCGKVHDEGKCKVMRGSREKVVGE